MKNFPHQISNFKKLNSALAVVAELINLGKDLSDDWVLGKALVMGHVYAFRDKSMPLKKALKEEKLKSLPNRGSGAAARDIRRFFLLLKFIQPDNTTTSKFTLTNDGKTVLNIHDVATSMAQWRDSMRNISLPDAKANISHPYKILLRLVNDIPGIENTKLLLALEAKDDSEAEYKRIVRLSKKDDEHFHAAMKISKSTASNALKILPAIARQLGDIITNGGENYPTPVIVTTEDGTFSAPSELLIEAGKTKNKKAVTANKIAVSPMFTDSGEVIVDLTDAINIRKDRTLEHQKAVRSLAQLLEKHKYDLFENPFDCLAFNAKGKSLLIEVKTLDGSTIDERQQAERAIGQIKGYRFFNIPNEHTVKNECDIVAFTRRPSNETIEFLKNAGVITIWLKTTNWQFVSKNGERDFSPDAL